MEAYWSDDAGWKLFQEDIYSNIAISAPQLRMDEAGGAAEAVGLGDDIREMPMGCIDFRGWRQHFWRTAAAVDDCLGYCD